MFFFHFCNFGRRPRFPDTGVTQTVTQTGQKCALAQLFRAKAFLLLRDYFSCSEDRCQDFLHGPGRLLLGRCGDMGIGVQGEAGGEVPQHSGHCLDVHSILKGQGCEGVPQIC